METKQLEIEVIIIRREKAEMRAKRTKVKVVKNLRVPLLDQKHILFLEF